MVCSIDRETPRRSSDREIDDDSRSDPGHTNASAFNVRKIYEGSDGEATKAHYAHMTTLGPRGVVAVNLMRTLKASGRAKVYRGRPGRGEPSYRALAYEKKDWSIVQLVAALKAAPDAIPCWGWGHDPRSRGFEYVIYIDLPGAGQVSFHSAYRKDGPDYPGLWDGVRSAARSRILRWTEAVLEGREATSTQENDDGVHAGTEGAATQGAPGSDADQEQQKALDL